MAEEQNKNQEQNTQTIDINAINERLDALAKMVETVTKTVTNLSTSLQDKKQEPKKDEDNTKNNNKKDVDITKLIEETQKKLQEQFESRLKELQIENTFKSQNVKDVTLLKALYNQEKPENVTEWLMNLKKEKPFLFEEVRTDGSKNPQKTKVDLEERIKNAKTVEELDKLYDELEKLQ